MIIDREADRTPAQSRAYAGALAYLRRGEDGRELATAALVGGGYPAERAAAMVEAILRRRARRRAARPAARSSGPAAVAAVHIEAAYLVPGTKPVASAMLI